MPRAFILLYFLLLIVVCPSSNAEPSVLKPFVPGSYQQLLASKTNKPFMLVVWSITCSSCLKDMALLHKVHQANPKLNIVMLTTDDVSATEQIQQILSKNHLTDLENWFFADENAQKLRYEIDPQWFGELPRTYFFDKTHQREGISGVLTQADYEQRFKKMLK